MSEEIIKGKVEAKNKKGDMPLGLKINGVWYNCNETTEKYCNQIQKGQEVELKVEKKIITFVKTLNKPIEQVKAIEKQGSKIDPYHHSAFVGMAIKVANLRVNSMPNTDKLTPNAWSITVLEHASLLIQECKKRRILEGEDIPGIPTEAPMPEVQEDYI